jgi:hypothetical protein
MDPAGQGAGLDDHGVAAVAAEEAAEFVAAGGQGVEACGGGEGS